MIIQTIKVLTETLENIRRKKTINFIPTMGNLHEGHLSLIKKSQKKDYVSLVSIFVNPLQFSEKNDLSSLSKYFFIPSCINTFAILLTVLDSLSARIVNCSHINSGRTT